MQRENARGEEFAPEAGAEPGPAPHPVPGRAQMPAAPCIDADIEAIGELQDRIRHLWAGLTEPSRVELGARLELLRAAAERRETDSKPVREALQQVLLNVGTGALATLGEATRQRLAALTGIALGNTVRGSPLRLGFDGPDAPQRRRGGLVRQRHNAGY